MFKFLIFILIYEVFIFDFFVKKSKIGFVFCFFIWVNVGVLIMWIGL